MLKKIHLLIFLLLLSCNKPETNPTPKVEEPALVPGGLGLQLISPVNRISSNIIYQVTNDSLPVVDSAYYCRGWVKSARSGMEMLNKELYRYNVPFRGHYKVIAFNTDKKYSPIDTFYFTLYGADSTVLQHSIVNP